MLKLIERPEIEADINVLAERLGQLLIEAMKQIGQTSSEDRLRTALETGLGNAEHRPTVAIVDLIAEDLRADNWCMMPDIVPDIVTILSLIYTLSIQANADAIWQHLYGAGQVDTVRAPGVTMPVPVDELEDRAQMLLARLDEGTVAYLATFLAGGAEFTPASIIQKLFEPGTAEQGTLLDRRVQIAVETETSWAINRCRLDMITAIGRNKEWRLGSVACDFAKMCAAAGVVPPGRIYSAMTGEPNEPITHPPGCLGCNCFLQTDVGEIEIEKKSEMLGQSCMIALDVPDEFETLLGVKTPHITLIYMGKVDEEQEERIKAVLTTTEYKAFPVWLTGQLAKLGPDNDRVDVALVGLSSELKVLNDTISTNLKQAGLLVPNTYGDYKPHVTLGKAGTVSQDVIKDFGGLWMCKGVRLWAGDSKTFFPFIIG